MLGSGSQVNQQSHPLNKCLQQRLKQQNFIFSQLWRLEVSDQGVSREGSFRSLPPWLADGCLLPVSLSSHALPSVSVSILLSSSKGTGHTGSGLTVMTFYESNYIFKDLVSTYSHVLDTGG